MRQLGSAARDAADASSAAAAALQMLQARVSAVGLRATTCMHASDAVRSRDSGRVQNKSRSALCSRLRARAHLEEVRGMLPEPYAQTKYASRLRHEVHDKA